MKKLFLYAGIGAVMMMASCSGNQNKVDEDSAKIADLTAEYQEATNFNDSLMLLMGDIYTGLDSINTQEGLLYNMTTGEGGDRRAEIRNNLSQIKARLAANRKLLEEMEAKVKASDKSSSVQARTIAQLRQHIEQQDEKIKQLESQLSSARAEIDTLTSTVARNEETIRQETAAKEKAQAAAEDAAKEANEANKVYYAIGSSKELKKKGLLEKKFLGTTKVLKGQFDASYFQVADKRTLKSIPTGSKNVKIWTNMPAGSYRIVGEKDGPKTIEIIDPAKFWSLSTHCVIQIN